MCGGFLKGLLNKKDWRGMMIFKEKVICARAHGVTGTPPAGSKAGSACSDEIANIGYSSAASGHSQIDSQAIRRNGE